jgi:hypothetical protein
MSTVLGRVPNAVALPLGFLLLPLGVILLPLAPELGVPLSLLATRFLGRKFQWARRFNAWIDAKWANLRTRMKTGRRPDHPKLWRWIVGTIVIVIAWQGIGLLLTVGAAAFFDYDLELLFSTDDADLAKVRELTPWSTAATVLISFIPLFMATLLVYRLLLKRNVKQLFTSFEKYSWKRTWIGFASLTLISTTFGIGDFILNRDTYTWNFDLYEFLPYLVIAKKQWTISLISGAIFALPHLANPEVAGNELLFPVISYGATGFMLAWVTYRDKTLEMAIGAHFANNLLAALAFSTEDSALPSVSLFTIPEVAWGPAAVFSVIMIPIFIWLTGKWKDKVSV